MKTIGTIARGIKTPIIKPGDDLVNVVTNSLMEASREGNFSFHDKDIVGITESVVGRCEENFVSVDDIASDIKMKYGDNKIGVIFPILSRNRFALCLKGIARGAKELVIMLSYPSDEVGNHLFDDSLLDKYNINPYSDTMDEDKYNLYFKDYLHTFTGVNYVSLYESIVKEENCKVSFVFSNNPLSILDYTDCVLTCDIHTRFHTKSILEDKARILYGLDDIMSSPINGSGYNKDYGLLGSNRSTDDTLKLFPRTGDEVVLKVQEELRRLTGKKIEVLIYGDGAFKDPVGKIWELADPVVSPAYTSGLEGRPNEIKIKYLTDNKYSNLSGASLNEAIKEEIKHKNNNLTGSMEALGTTPRRLTDLIGSLCDLTSGSGDKGTPIVLIQGYFDNYAND